MDKNCDVCVAMDESGLFSEKEITDYHRSKIDMSNFDRRQRDEMMYIYSELDDEA